LFGSGASKKGLVGGDMNRVREERVLLLEPIAPEGEGDVALPKLI
jgi:hypothetical protein